MTLGNLDTLIAFAVVMLALSLLITIFTQMISALLGYRGTNLLWGLTTLLKTVSPGMASEAENVARRVLTEDVFSDSIFSKFNTVPIIGPLVARWQLASAIGSDGLRRALTKVAQDLRASKGATADQIEAMLAEADPEAAQRLIAAGKALAIVAPNFPKLARDMTEKVTSSAEALAGKLDAWFDVTMKRVSQRFSTQMRIWTLIFAFLLAFFGHYDTFKILKQLSSDPELRKRLVDSRDDLLKEANAVGVSGKPSAGKDGAAPSPSGSPRTSPSPGTRPGPAPGTSPSAVPGASPAASPRSSPPTSGGQAASGGQQTQGGGAAGGQGEGSGTAPGQTSAPPTAQPCTDVAPEILKEAIECMKCEYGGCSPDGGADEKDCKARQPVCKDTKVSGDIGRLTCLKDAEDWLRQHTQTNDPTCKDQLVAEYKQLVLTTLERHAENIRSIVDGLQLMPKNILSFKDDSILGLLITGLFLSLGAPFWYNALKTLSSLRPLVATKQDQEKQQKQA